MVGADGYIVEILDADDDPIPGIAQVDVAGSNSAKNIARIESINVLDSPVSRPREPERRACSLVALLTDERNALERALLHFSHLKKETVRLDDKHYQMILYYDKADETELLIRVLSFGPMLQVISPNRFISKIRERLTKQKFKNL